MFHYLLCGVPSSGMGSQAKGTYVFTYGWQVSLGFRAFEKSRGPSQAKSRKPVGGKLKIRECVICKTPGAWMASRRSTMLLFWMSPSKLISARSLLRAGIHSCFKLAYLYTLSSRMPLAQSEHANPDLDLFFVCCQKNKEGEAA